MNKRGIVTASLALISMISIIILFVIVSIYTSINLTKERVRKDISYIVTNGIDAYNKEELSLENYVFDKKKFKDNVEYLLTKNYSSTNNLIKEIKVKELEVIYEKEKIEQYIFKVPYVYIKVEVTLKDIYAMLPKEPKLVIEDKIKLALLEY